MIKHSDFLKYSVFNIQYLMKKGFITMNESEKEIQECEPAPDEKKSEDPGEIQEIVIEELAVDGICGIY